MDIIRFNFTSLSTSYYFVLQLYLLHKDENCFNYNCNSSFYISLYWFSMQIEQSVLSKWKLASRKVAWLSQIEYAQSVSQNKQCQVCLTLTQASLKYCLSSTFHTNKWRFSRHHKGILYQWASQKTGNVPWQWALYEIQGTLTQKAFGPFGERNVVCVQILWDWLSDLRQKGMSAMQQDRDLMKASCCRQLQRTNKCTSHPRAI